MKKNLLLIAALAVAMGASAQASYNFVNMEELGYSDVEVQAGTVFLTNEYGELSLTYTDNLKTFTPAADPYTHISVGGGEAQKITAGITGTTNGKSPLNAGVATLPETGLIYKLTMKQTGYVIVLTKMNTNKNYYVMQGKNNLVAYDLGVALPAGEKNTSGLTKISYTLPENAFGNVDMEAADASKYLDGEAPAFTKIKTPGDTQGCGNTGEGSGFLAFLSFGTPEAPMDYYFWAQGSKMANNGFIFVPDADPYLNKLPEVVYSGVDKVDEATGAVTPAPEPVSFTFGEGAGIDNIVVDAVEDANAPMYNVLGQRVDESYKGLVIKNGKKFINK